jgi:hypothetical protein
MTTPDGRTITLPAGVTEAQVRGIMQKRMSGGELTAAERATLRSVFQAAGGGSGGGRVTMGGPGGAARGGDATSYIVFVLRDGKPAPLRITTGLTDLDFVEVVSGLTEQDTVLALPSASLVNAQREMRDRMTRMTGGGLPGLQQQPTGGQRTQVQTRP